MSTQTPEEGLRKLLLELASSSSNLAVPAIALLTGGRGPSNQPIEKILIGGVVKAWRVFKSKRATQNPDGSPAYYLVIPGNFCTCYYFQSEVLSGQRLTCKHELAVLMLGKGERPSPVSWDEYESVIRSLPQRFCSK